MPLLIATVLALLAQSSPQIEALERQVLRLLVEGKAAEALPILEKARAANPHAPEVHALLASTHEVLAESFEGQPERAAARRAHLERAALHYRRVVGMTHVNRASHLRSLAEIHLPGGLNDLPEAERHARRLAAEHPDLSSGHALLVRALVAARRSTDAVAVLRGMSALALRDQAHAVAEGLQDVIPPAVTVDRAVLGPVLDAALRIATAAMTAEPGDGELAMLMSGLLETQARKVETDPARQRALLAESERLWEQGRRLNQARRGVAPPEPPAVPSIPEPPPVPPPSPPAVAAFTRGVTLWNEVSSTPSMAIAEAARKLQSATAALDEALQTHPPYAEAMVYKALVLSLRASKYERDAARAAALAAEAERLRARALELQRAKVR